MSCEKPVNERGFAGRSRGGSPHVGGFPLLYVDVPFLGVCRVQKLCQMSVRAVR